MMTNTMERAGGTSTGRCERTRVGPVFLPNVDILETTEDLLVHADMPGVSADSVNVQFENGTLTIEGSVPSRCPESCEVLHREYGVGDFFRTFEVSESIDSQRITAEFRDGVLTLRLPKAAAARSRRIEVRET